MVEQKKKFLSTDEADNHYTILLLTPGGVEMCQKGVKGNFLRSVRLRGGAGNCPFLSDSDEIVENFDHDSG